MIYRGVRTSAGCRVTADDNPLQQRQDVRNHSPDGFEWGYEGSGPAQLALAILCNEFDEKVAMQHYQAFKREVVGKFDRDRFELTSAGIRDWLSSK